MLSQQTEFRETRAHLVSTFTTVRGKEGRKKGSETGAHCHKT